MANHFRLYGRPLMADDTSATLSVTGELESYTTGAAYESRLQINNSVGRCTVRVISSDLPPGAAVRVDNLTKEVVVKWEAYREVAATQTLLPNGGFEDGDDGTWDLVGPGWSIGSGPEYRVETGTHSARFADVKTKGSDMLAPRIPAKVNDYIRVEARIQQGDSSGSACGARVWMRYYDANDIEVGNHPGNLITTDRGGSWDTSTAEGGAPAGTASVLVYIAAYRNKENKPLWVDNVTWDHKYTLGQNGDEVYTLSLEVTDSLNRKAYWSGETTKFAVYRTSTLYPLDVDVDYLEISPRFISASTHRLLLDYTIAADNLTISPLFLSASSEVSSRTVNQPAELLVVAPVFISAATSATIRNYTPPAESLTVLPVFMAASTKMVLISRTQPVESISIAPIFIGGTLT